MKAYLDTGVFIDYLIDRGHAGPYLRSTNRRGRTPTQLGADAESCLTRLAANHEAITSSLTGYEVEEAIYRQLAASSVGLPYTARYLIPSARSALTQTLMTIEIFSVGLVALTDEVILAQCRDIELQMKGIRAADALHVTTARLHDADLLISTDSGILGLDSVLKTVSGKTLRCVDTDKALTLI